MSSDDKLILGIVVSICATVAAIFMTQIIVTGEATGIKIKSSPATQPATQESEIQSPD